MCESALTVLEFSAFTFNFVIIAIQKSISIPNLKQYLQGVHNILELFVSLT